MGWGWGEGEGEGETEKERQRWGERERERRDSENNSTFYSFLWSAHRVLETLLDPGTVAILILTAKDQL